MTEKEVLEVIEQAGGSEAHGCFALGLAVWQAEPPLAQPDVDWGGFIGQAQDKFWTGMGFSWIVFKILRKL